MGWFWDSKPSQSSTGDEAYSKLDPTLRDFLDKESSSQQASQTPIPESRERAPRSADGAPTTYRSQIGINTPGLSVENQNSIPPENQPAVPPESLYQDGRYAHLWKTYRSQSSIDATSKTDQDRLLDVVDAYRDRKAAIGRAALENCVMEQIAEKDCFAGGGWKKYMGMCRTENKAFNRCYTMQSRFLKALGYLSYQHTSDEEEEKIQMHADKLYTEMLQREASIEEAKKAGQEAPKFDPLIHTERLTKELGEDSAYARARRKARDEMLPTNLSAYTPEKQEEIKERLKGLNEQQKEVELQLIAAESRAQLEYADQVREHMDEERMHRRDRRERGKETVGDTIKRFWGWSQ
ncbi:hypothetical protein LTR37_014886 [Vermiconidia calcicola]|uniref:Uncharacterized protein n=1 Tax=Vermiconidia calcicola TaxID=1690605 RepID=A0ACC3MSC3_9PEZI|nr:hypothetical protein LTR37_014886 [Vermiconidia calcicola]